MVNLTTTDIVGGVRLPVGRIVLTGSYAEPSGKAALGVKVAKGFSQSFQGAAVYNTTTNTWSAELGLGDSTGDYSQFAGQKGIFAGVGVDNYGAYFVIKAGATFPAGTLPITPFFTSVQITTKEAISWEEIGDAFAAAIDYANGVASGLASDLSSAIDAAAAAFFEAIGMPSPIVLDLDGDGLELVSLASSKTWFDIDNDLFAERTGWLKGDDAFLARDLNGNGQIDNQGELFGDNGGTSAYAKLAALDTNRDGKVSSADSGFATLRLWRDTNQDGRVDSGELKTLAAAGIASLSTASTASSATNQGHAIVATSTFTRTNGTTGNAADVRFQVDDVNSWYVGTDVAAPKPFDSITLALPLSRGYGTLPSWTEAFSMNATLKTKALDITDEWGTQLNPQLLQAKIEAFMYEWAGVSTLNPTSRGPHIDARKLAFLEKMADDTFINTGSPDPRSYHAVELLKGWDAVYSEVASRLLIQGPLASIIPAHYQYIDDKIVFDASLPDILSQVSLNAPTNTKEHFFYWQAVGMALEGQHGGFGLTAGGLAQALNNAASYPILTGADVYLGGTSVAEALTGTTAHEYLFGLAGNDTLTGGEGNDILSGGKGNDSIQGEDGNDIFVIARGDGIDTVAGGRNIDTLSFGSGITWANLQFSRPSENDILITLPGGGSVLILRGAESGDWPVEEFSFADQTTKTLTDVYVRMTSTATGGNDTILGFQAGNDTISAGAGNDVITGLGGNDTLTGGTGNDSISAGDGNDTTTINQGDGVDTVFGGRGQDIVSFGSGVSWTNIQITRSGASDLLFTLPGGGKVLMSRGAGDGDWGVETFRFADGTTKTLGQVEDRLNAQFTAGNDTINGFNDHNDTIKGGAGNDVINGFDGLDVLSGDAGQDTLSGGHGNDIFDYNVLADSTSTAPDLIKDFDFYGDDRIDLRGLGFTGVAAGAATGTKLGYAFDSATNKTTITAVSNFKIVLDGQPVIDASDFIFT